ncbi:MAG: isoleucine--tRNA ligase [Phycisphaeraceae bacterium]|nr:isoleucine--tRNA ligase [Phycisphaeraceae bacterium]
MNADQQTQNAPKPQTNGDGARSAVTDSSAAGGARSYKETLNLPKTAFSMKANLVQNEPASLKRWAGLAAGKGLYRAVVDARARSNHGRFVFHDGPPYANGSIHMGHLMNKTLKDFVVRSKAMAGLHCPYVPGWDCHGLPIEHKVMTELKEAGKLDKLMGLEEGARKMAVRRECKKYAEKFVKLHVGQMSRLLTLADYDDPYLTMNPAYEGATLEVLADLVEQGLVYRALKPVHWSVDNQTALAEAELEYEDREDLSVYVDFEAESADAVYDAFGLTDLSEDEGEDDEETEETDENEELGRPTQRPSFMIWTTTPWTLPANLAVAVNPKFEYALVKVDGNVTVLAAAAVERVTKAAKSEDVTVLATTTGDKLVGLRYRHPFVDASVHNLRTEGEMSTLDVNGPVFTIVAAEYVTLEDGTGLVHTAPGHGTEDYQTGLRERLPIYCPVRADGTYDDSVPAWLRGKSIWKANAEVAEHLRQSGHMFFDHVFTHSYPHDWRSKGPVIFRCTEQWFVAVDGGGGGATKRNLREMALHAINRDSNPEAVEFVPEWGRNRMRGMLEARPDWCISRQRAWGLPIPAFFVPDSNGYRPGFCLMTSASVRAVAKVFRETGSDAWFTLGPADLLKYYNPDADRELPKDFANWMRDALPTLTKGSDILDVWFESGSSWNAVMRERGMAHTDRPYFVDLYLEGSDQHRGWFQLSLLPALGATGKTPFHTLLTHGFMVAKDGRKLSKSQGDSVDDLFQKYGADVMRWWVCSLSYDNDVKVDSSFFELAGESYRKVRNTLRFMLSNLDDFTPSCDGKAGHCVDAKDFAPTSLDAWVLAEYDRLAAEVIRSYETYEFARAHELIYEFCNRTLSAVYLAAVKDRLYCDKSDSPRRRRTQTALWDLTDGLCRLLAPVLVHTADEAHRALRKVDPKDADACVHLKTFITSFGVKADDAWPVAMNAIESARLVLEQAKADLGVKDPLDAGVILADPDGRLARFDPTDLADLLGVSRVELDPKTDKARVLDLRDQPQCERSWKRDGTVRQRSDGGMLSDRDAEAIGMA